MSNVYCEGVECSRRDTCAYHSTIKDGLAYYIDYSKTGGAIADMNGYREWTDCGDRGNYAKFQEL